MTGTSREMEEGSPYQVPNVLSEDIHSSGLQDLTAEQFSPWRFFGLRFFNALKVVWQQNWTDAEICNTYNYIYTYMI